MAFLPHTNSFESMVKLAPTTSPEPPSTPTPQHVGNPSMTSKFKDLSFQDVCNLVRTTPFSTFSNSGDAKPRSETSLLYPSQAPLTFKAGTFPQSLFYTIVPAQSQSRVRFLEALRGQFPENGLRCKNNSVLAG